VRFDALTDYLELDSQTSGICEKVCLSDGYVHKTIMTTAKTRSIVGLIILALFIALPATTSSASRRTGRGSRHASSHVRSYNGRHRSRRTTSELARDKHGTIRRSTSAKHAFEKQHPCPSTGLTSGRCPGYVVDHVQPLQCGGADAPANMQWQTIAEGKAKDRAERGCR
jgi:hypothetical protein